MPLPIAQPRSVGLRRSWRGRRYGRGTVQAPGLARPVLPRQQYRAPAATDATPTLPPPSPLPRAERPPAPRPLTQVFRAPAAGPVRLRSLSYPATSEDATWRHPAPTLQHGIHHTPTAVPSLSHHPHYPTRTLPLATCGGTAGWRCKAPADHFALHAPPPRSHTLSQPRRAHTLPAQPLPLRLPLHPLCILHPASPDALSAPRHTDASATLCTPVPSPLLHPTAPSTLSLASPIGWPALPAPRGRRRARRRPQIQTSQPDQHGRVRRQKLRAVVRHPAVSHQGAVARGSRRRRRRVGGGQMQVCQNGRLVRKRVLRAGKRKLLSLCYFHIHFPRK